MGQESTHLSGWLGGLEEVMLSIAPHTEEALCKSWPFCQRATRWEGLQRHRVRGGLSDKVTFKPWHDENEEQGKSDLGRGYSKCKGPGAGKNTSVFRNSKEASVAGGEGLRGRVVDDEGRVVLGSLGRWWR